MFSLLLELQADIEDAIAGVDCDVERVTVTAGEYAPVSNCNAVYIWGSQVSDENQFVPDACIVKSRFVLSYRIDVCYREQENDQTDAQHSEVAECFYGLQEAIWCHLVSLRDAGTLLGVDACEDVSLGALVTNDRAGAVVSATGTVTVPLECAASS